MSKKPIFKIFLFLLFGILIIFLFLFLENKKEEKYFLKINSIQIELEIARTPQQHYQGLSFRESLDDNSGMIFLFPDKEIRKFVMRDMLMSIDIIFIDDNEIVDIHKNLPFDLESQEIIYSSSVPVDKVLELKAGFSDQYNLSVGDKLELIKNN
ncbi:MAG: DUF192 domain-containing protein [Patescibacteria group bacterium]|jgi:uncharacterized membrane protein (UPF0127 family)|nr:DUF192 domain-containing protein [Patescibacteria group bacterium]